MQKVEARSGTLGMEIRRDFPIFQGDRINLAYLDTAASSQKPSDVIERLSDYLSFQHANIHRGAYALSAHATEMYEEARAKVARFVGAKDPSEIIFVRGCTEGVNLVASSYGETLAPGSTILLSVLEHHSNIVPWQLLSSRRGINLQFIDVTDSGALDLDDAIEKIRKFRPSLVGISALSNAIGTVIPIKEIIEETHSVGGVVLVDAAQSIAHQQINLTELNADFIVASGHKLYGPTGIGFLYGKLALLDQMGPYQGGGDMIQYVSLEGSTWAEVPRRFEAGTPAIAEAIALGAAVDYLERIGMENIRRYEHDLFHRAADKLRSVSGLHLLGPITRGGEQSSILSFTVDGVHPHDLSTILDTFNVQIRAGHHCAMPLLKRLGLQSTARASIGLYSTDADFDRLIEGVSQARKMFGH